MEGFLTIRVRPWLRRLTTRTLAIVPAAIADLDLAGGGTLRLLILSQVILSLQLAVRHHSADSFHERPSAHGRVRERDVGEGAGWATGDGGRGVEPAARRYMAIAEWLRARDPGASDHGWEPMPDCGGLLLALLAWITVRSHTRRPAGRCRGTLGPERRAPGARSTSRNTDSILVPLDHSGRDRMALGHAAALARGTYGAKSTCSTSRKELPARSTGRRLRRRKWRRARNIWTAWSSRSGRGRIHVEAAIAARVGIRARRSCASRANRARPAGDGRPRA